jgi:hypothetical protein
MWQPTSDFKNVPGWGLGRNQGTRLLDFVDRTKCCPATGWLLKVAVGCGQQASSMGEAENFCSSYGGIAVNIPSSQDWNS